MWHSCKLLGGVFFYIMINQQQLKDHLDYDPNTGIFTWVNALSPRVRNGDVAGTDHDGYVRIKVRGEQYAAHRLAWLWVHGCFPPSQVDHINGKRDDNRIKNIRIVTHNVNMKNKRLYKNNTSGIHGVTRCKRYPAWVATCKDQAGKQIHLGRFKVKEDAIKARAEAVSSYNYHPNHGTL